MKKVAVLLSTYNGENYLECQLNSLLNQNYSDIDIYIRDDGSSDNTIQVIRQFEDKYENLHFMTDSKNLGCASSFLFLLENIDADYYFFCDQDDVWHYNKIQVSLSVFEESDGPHLSHCDLNIVDEKLNILNDSFYKHQALNPIIGFEKNRLLVQNYIVGCTICLNRKLRDLVVTSIRNNDVIDVAMHDWWVALIARFFGKITFIHKSLIDYRQHQSNVLGASNNSLSRYLSSFISGTGVQRVRSFTSKVSLQASVFYLSYGEHLSDYEKCIVQRATKFDTTLGFINMFKLMCLNKMRLQGLKRNFALLFTSLIK
jgi:rhamnosyltransferase